MTEKNDPLERESGLRRLKSSLSSWNTKTTDQISENTDEEGSHYVNQYRMIGNLGEGMYGKVALAKDINNGNLYAIKVLRKQRLKRMRRLRPGKISDALQDILVEIAIMKKLNHPNVIKLYEVLDDPENDKLYLVLEWAEKGQAMKMDERETMTPLDEENAWKYFRDLINGLDYLHVQNIVHRDIKPGIKYKTNQGNSHLDYLKENLLVSSDNTLKICDFGVAQVLDNSRQNLWSSQGSPAFLAPEIASNKPFRGKPLDVWAAGVTLYCFLFGRVPFHGNTFIDLVYKLRNQELSFPCKIEQSLENLLRGLLEKDPEKRLKIPQVKVHPWVTKDGKYIMPESQREEWVTEEEIRSAIKPIDNIAILIRAKSMGKKWITKSRENSPREELRRILRTPTPPCRDSTPPGSNIWDLNGLLSPPSRFANERGITRSRSTSLPPSPSAINIHIQEGIAKSPLSKENTYSMMQWSKGGSGSSNLPAIQNNSAPPTLRSTPSSQKLVDTSIIHSADPSQKKASLPNITKSQTDEEDFKEKKPISRKTSTKNINIANKEAKKNKKLIAMQHVSAQLTISPKSKLSSSLKSKLSLDLEEVKQKRLLSENSDDDLDEFSKKTVTVNDRKLSQKSLLGNTWLGSDATDISTVSVVQ